MLANSHHHNRTITNTIYTIHDRRTVGHCIFSLPPRSNGDQFRCTVLYASDQSSYIGAAVATLPRLYFSLRR